MTNVFTEKPDVFFSSVWIFFSFSTRKLVDIDASVKFWFDLEFLIEFVCVTTEEVPYTCLIP